MINPIQISLLYKLKLINHINSMFKRNVIIYIKILLTFLIKYVLKSKDQHFSLLNLQKFYMSFEIYFMIEMDHYNLFIVFILLIKIFILIINLLA